VTSTPAHSQPLTCRTRLPSTEVHSHTTCTSKLLPSGQSFDSSSAATKRLLLLSTGTDTALLLHCIGPALLLLPIKPMPPASGPGGTAPGFWLALLPAPAAAADTSPVAPSAPTAAAALLPLGVRSVTGSCVVPEMYATCGRGCLWATGPVRLRSLTPAGSCTSSTPSQPNLLCAMAAMLEASGGCSCG
jgi:hypothetical protein